MGIKEIMKKYKEVREEYREIGIYDDMNVFYKLCEENGEKKEKYLLRVSSDSFQEPEEEQLKEIKKKFGNLEEHLTEEEAISELLKLV